MKSILSILCVLCASVVSLPAFAQDKIEIKTKTLIFQNGLDGYSGALEAGIRKGGDSSDPKATLLQVGRDYDRRENTLKQNMQALVRFDGIFGEKPTQVPQGAIVTKATLRIWIAPNPDNKPVGATQRIYMHRMLMPWDANATWKNPRWGGDGILANGRDATAEHDTLFVPNIRDATLDIDVTDSLRAWAAGQPNHGWVMRNIKGNGFFPISFATSREENPARRPMLAVTFDTNPANKAPVMKNPAATPNGPNSVTLSLTATDDDKLPLNVTFYGRKRAKAGSDFQVILLPDTQHYTSESHGAEAGMFFAQTDWIVKNHKERNIAFVLQLGDIVDSGKVEKQWRIASDAFRRLENSKTTGLRDGIPYIVAVGNHDRTEGRVAGKAVYGPAPLYNKYFGIDRFRGRGYYGGSFRSDSNNNYYTLFDAGDEKFIVISFEFRFAKENPGILEWASALLEKHAGRHAIAITHAALWQGIQSNFAEPDGEKVFKALRKHSNFRLLIGGHVPGEGRRTDRHDGRLIHSILKDFQEDNGGDGWLGILTFSPRNNNIRVQTYSPWLDKWRTDQYVAYTLDYDFGTKIEPYEKLGEVQVSSGGQAAVQWKGLERDTDYEWYAEVSDGQKTTTAKELVISN